METTTAHTKCAVCGFNFPKPQRRDRCQSANACAKRAAGPSTTPLMPKMAARRKAAAIEQAVAAVARDWASAATVTDGILRWTSNGQVPTAGCIGDALADGFITADQHDASADASKVEAAAFFAAYRANQRPASAEERFEMTAAFGPGVEVVDVVSGRRTITGPVTCVACEARGENHGGVVTTTADGHPVHVSCRTGEFADA